MSKPSDILNEEQIKNYHATLRIALAKLNEDFTGKMMHIAGNGDASRLYKVLNFNIIPIEKGGLKLTNATTFPHILSADNVIDLAIMVRYSDYLGNEGLMEVNSFLSANNIKKL